MIKTRIVLIGGGNQVSYVADIIEKKIGGEIVGIIDSVKEIGTEVSGYKIIGRQEDLLELMEKHNFQSGIVTIGDNYSRFTVYESIKRLCPDFNFVNAIHPSVIVGNGAIIGKGVVAMAGVIFNTNCHIGEGTFFATGAQIEHDCDIEPFASVSAGTVLGGFVKLGMFSALTLNVTVLDRVSIGINTVVGAGSLVLKDLPHNVLAYGNPCKIIRSRELNEKFLK
jgi:sugar O-acyltransferase (sialic acid O-acetyltransferase NeuD family)